MRINSICILTRNVRKLCSFYSKVLDMKPTLLTLYYIEFNVNGVVISLYDIEEHNKLTEPIAFESGCHSLIEIQVDNIEKEYDRLCKLGVRFAKPLSIQAWGSTSTYFYDPDGNLISFYSLQ